MSNKTSSMESHTNLCSAFFSQSSLSKGIKREDQFYPPRIESMNEELNRVNKKKERLINKLETLLYIINCSPEKNEYYDVLTTEYDEFPKNFHISLVMFVESLITFIKEDKMYNLMDRFNSLLKIYKSINKPDENKLFERFGEAISIFQSYNLYTQNYKLLCNITFNM